MVGGSFRQLIWAPVSGMPVSTDCHRPICRFITRDDDNGDVFVHVRNLPEGMDELAVGTLVEFEVSPSQRFPGKFEAKNVKVLP